MWRRQVTYASIINPNALALGFIALIYKLSVPKLSPHPTEEASSDEVLAQVFAAEDVHVEVHDGLAGVNALVGDDAETVLQALGLSNLLDGMGHGAHGLGRHVISDVAVVLLGDHERMNRCLGIEVIERDDLVVLVDNSRGDLVVGDFTEDAITHGWFLSNDNATEGGVVQ